MCCLNQDQLVLIRISPVSEAVVVHRAVVLLAFAGDGAESWDIGAQRAAIEDFLANGELGHVSDPPPWHGVVHDVCGKANAPLVALCNRHDVRLF